MIPKVMALIGSNPDTYVRRMVTSGTYSLTEKVMPMPYCADGVNAGKWCFDKAQCPGSSCANANTNFSASSYNSFLAMNIWQEYDSCLDNDSCPKAN